MTQDCPIKTASSVFKLVSFSWDLSILTETAEMWQNHLWPECKILHSEVGCKSAGSAICLNDKKRFLTFFALRKSGRKLIQDQVNQVINISTFAGKEPQHNMVKLWKRSEGQQKKDKKKKINGSVGGSQREEEKKLVGGGCQSNIFASIKSRGWVQRWRLPDLNKLCAAWCTFCPEFSSAKCLQ